MTKRAVFFLVLAFMAAGFVHGIQRVKVTVDKANVRAEADRTAAVIRVVSRDEVFTVLEKNGPWFKIALPVDNADEPQSGFIHEIVVETVSAGQETESATPAKRTGTDADVREREEKTVPKREAAVSSTGRGEPEKKLFSGLSLKFGLMTSPKDGTFGDRWILAAGFDKGLSRYLAVGLEFQPYFRSYSDAADLSVIAANAFFNVKAGVDLGEFVRFLKFMKPYAGIGAGAELANMRVSYQGESQSKFNVHFAWHMILGSEFSLKGLDLIFEYQAIRVSNPDIDPGFFRHFLMFGVRF